MQIASLSPLRVFLAIALLLAPAGARAQDREQDSQEEEDAYGTKFFDQLSAVFGRFRDSDLRRVFQTADPVQCSELTVNKGEWRTVAFFNEDRGLGEWCRNNLDEVKSDLSLYRFKGSCRGDQGTIQLTTEFPVTSSAEAYSQGRISLREVDVNVNAPVSVVFDVATQAYTFELPYLFVIGRRGSGTTYSLMAPNIQSSYATDVTSRWECKAVRSSDVTYRFLICRTATLPRKGAERNRNWVKAFGSSAYFILSDGMEASSSVSVRFADAGPPADKAPAVEPPVPAVETPAPKKPETAAPAVIWQRPDARSSVVELGKGQFRLRFSPQTWTGKIGLPQILFDQKVSNQVSTRPPEGTDYCLWNPIAANSPQRLLANDPGNDVLYSMLATDKKGILLTSVLFDLRVGAGVQLGTLNCFFPRAESAAGIALDLWVSVVGAHVALEIRK